MTSITFNVPEYSIIRKTENVKVHAVRLLKFTPCSTGKPWESQYSTFNVTSFNDPAIPFICRSDDSDARHISSALFRVRSASRSKRLHTLSLFTPQTTRSLIRESFKFSNSQELANNFKSFTYYASIDSDSP